MRTLKQSLIILLTYFIFISSAGLYAQPGSVVSGDVSDNSLVMNHNIPSYLKPGQSYSVSITMRNLGTNTWTMKDDYRLKLYSSDNMNQSDVWGVRSVALPNDVPPSEKVTFNFDIYAPQAGGNYNNQWSMSKGDVFFGDKTPAILITVAGEPTPVGASNSAEFVDLSVPSTMVAGQKYKVLVTMRNNGTSAWLPNSTVRLVPYNDPNEKSSNPDWGISPQTISQSLDPGQTHTFEFEVTAPNPGTYNLQWMMMNGNSYFGDKSKTIAVNVTDNRTQAAYNGSSFVDQSVPLVMTPNKEYTVSITMTNTGKSPWVKNRYHLSLVDPRMLPLSMNPWSAGYVDVPEDVQPGSTVTFTTNLTAPINPGTYPFQWSMMEDGTPFGESTPALQISVKNNND